MQDAWRAYLELALGLSEASRKKATKVAKQLLGKGGATAEQLQTVAEDLVRTSAANREAIAKLVRYELDRALGVVGLATSEEVTDLTARVRDLEQQLHEAQARAAVVTLTETPLAGATATRTAVAKKAVAKKAVAKKAVAKKAVAKKAVATKAEPAKTVTRKAVAKKTVAKKTVAKKTLAKKAVANKAGGQ
jgi:polyhydroxyalkanoate synthesis regulator phasin